MKLLPCLLLAALLMGCSTMHKHKEQPVAHPPFPRGKWFVAEITFYCPCEICCGPKARGITASGVPARAGVTVAASRTLPFGTEIHIKDIGHRIVQDRLAPQYDYRFDVFVNTHEEAKRLGIRRAWVYIEK